jgi:hypothetical protein
LNQCGFRPTRPLRPAWYFSIIMPFISLRNNWLQQLLFIPLSVGLIACHEQPAQVAIPTRIFRRGQQFTYQVAHRLAPGATVWLDTLTILCYGKFKPEDHNGASRLDQASDTLQSKLGFGYGAHTAPDSFAGVVEDDSTLWSHPPRDGEYRVLELSPYPYLKFPLRRGKRWTDSLAVGAWYGNPAWAVWQGDMWVTSTYTVQGQKPLHTPFGLLLCWVIEATATCAKGASTLEIWYHPQYGFVRLNYQTINHKILDLGLVQVAAISLPETKTQPEFIYPINLITN